MRTVVTKTFKYDDKGRVIEETTVTEGMRDLKTYPRSPSYPVYPSAPTAKPIADWLYRPGTVTYESNL